MLFACFFIRGKFWWVFVYHNGGMDNELQKTKDQIKSMQFYVINVLTGQESIIAGRIKDLKHPGINKVHNPLSILKAPVFSGYLFLETKLTSDVYYAVLNTPGVFCFLSDEFPIEDSESKIVLDYDKGHISAIGLNAKIVKNKYKGLIGIIDSINYPYVKLKINLFGENPIITERITNIILIEQTPKTNIIKPGETVKIIKSNYLGLEGIIKYIKNNIATIQISVFNQTVFVEIDTDCIEPCRETPSP